MKKFFNLLSVGALLICLAVSFNAYAQPANDECANATDISSLFDGACGVSNLSMVIDNTGATGNATDPPEPGEAPGCPQTTDTNLFGDTSNTMETSIWFTFTVPDLNGDGSPVEYSLWTSDGSYGDCGLNPNNILDGDADTQVAIYESNTCPDNTLGDCDYFAANEDLFTSPPWISGWLSLAFTPGQTYYMLIDSWDGVMGEFCLSVTPCGTVCGDAACAPVETYCDCSDDCACDFANFGYVRYSPPEYNEGQNPGDDGYFFTDSLDAYIVQCSDFYGLANGNFYLSVGATNFTDCAGNTGDMTITYDNGALQNTPGGSAQGGADIASGDMIAVGTLFFFELTPADIAAGNININACVDDGLGGQCCQDLVIDLSIIPGITAPYCPCVPGSITDPAVITQTVCPGVGQTINLCTDGNEDLTITCPDGSAAVYGWRVSGDPNGYITQLTDWILGEPCADYNVDDVFIDAFGYVPPYFTPGYPLIPATYFIEGAFLCVSGDNVDLECIASGFITADLLDGADPLCQEVIGCTDPCDPNYDPNATQNDPALCAGYDDTCNADCTAGPFGGTWDAATCACINETAPVNGCTDATACNFDAAANCDDGTCDFGNAACADPCNPVMGCTDAAACNFDAAACVDDGTCDLGNPACADPCNEVPGCTDATACNFDAAACVDDGTCDFGNAACSDPCNPVSGCTDATACNFNPAACVDDGSCAAPPCNPGCTDPCADNYDATADEDDGSCNPYDDTCNADCTVGPFGGTWDPVACTCVNETTPVNGCTDPDAGNYDPAANCDDGSCVAGCTATAATIAGGPFEFCVGDGTPDFVSGITVSGGTGANTAWVITDDALNILGLPGMPGEVDFDGAGFGNCLIWYVTFDDITGAEVGMNAADLTGCFALSNSIEVVRNDCGGPCEDEIAGSINAEMGCDVSGTAVLITDVAGNPLGMAIADASGNYILPGGPYPCGEYIATLDVASVPACYADAGGDVGPAGFTVNGDGTADGADFSSFDEVPTLSQWGLMTLALLLMTLGALKLGFVNNVQTNPNRRK